MVYRKGTTTLLASAGLALVLAMPSWAQENKDVSKNVGKDTSKDAGMTIADGKQVSLEFTLSLEDKTQVQSNVGQEPLVYTQGSKQIIPGLEKHMVGLKAGDKKHVEVPPEDGYGPVDPTRTQEVEKEKIPEQARKVGSQLTGRGPQGQMMFAQVKEVKDKTVVLDLNHPLAGKKLIFDVTVLKVENPPLEKKAEAPSAAPEVKVETPTSSASPEAKPKEAK